MAIPRSNCGEILAPMRGGAPLAGLPRQVLERSQRVATHEHIHSARMRDSALPQCCRNLFPRRSLYSALVQLRAET
jgi:hypothetical protein